MKKVNSKLPLFSDLDSSNRGAPCQEYPGTYIAYLDGKEIGATYLDGKLVHVGFSTQEKAEDAAYQQWQHAEWDSNPKASVSWKCSDNDPRIGEVWFSPFYQVSKINSFGFWFKRQ